MAEGEEIVHARWKHREHVNPLVVGSNPTGPTTHLWSFSHFTETLTDLVGRNTTLLLSGLAALQVHPCANAIVVRHDRDDGAFVALGQKFPTTARVRLAAYPDWPGDAGTLIDARWVLTAAHVA